jgi:hypothetical protein
LSATRQDTDSLADALQQLGKYVASYGERTSVIVAEERYTQQVSTSALGPRREIVAEFAIVKTNDGWTGYRDVVEVDSKKVTDRRDRLLELFTSPSVSQAEFLRIANESARYNIGPVTTNLNLPTTALFFFQSGNLNRFTFVQAGARSIGGTQTVEIAFKEVKSPTLVGTRGGRDVPVAGKLWIIPNDGTVVRSRLELRGFSDVVVGSNPSPARRFTTVDEIKSSADIEVTYKLESKTGLWLPSEMLEMYEGAIKLGARPPFYGSSVTRARYSNFRQFGSGARVKIPQE